MPSCLRWEEKAIPIQQKSKGEKSHSLAGNEDEELGNEDLTLSEIT